MSFPKNCKFKYPWRNYQSRLLKEIETHLDDNHLHLIAPPGSGKTVVGLEIAIRLNKPTLILAPTIAIRDQWIQRLCSLFLDTNIIPEWISTDIKEPRFLTVSTYQGMHSAIDSFKNKESNDIIESLKRVEIETLVADEAHHLKNAWWQSLNKIKTILQPKIIGLTATPPYDVSGLEWQRYIQFNGPVDAEISVPELVKNNDLCPHQDFVYFSLPTQDELAKIKDHQDNIQFIFNELKNNDTLIKIGSHFPAWVNPNEHLEWIYTNLEQYASVLIFLHANKVDISENHLAIFGQENLEIPYLDFSWFETFLNFILFDKDEYFSSYENERETFSHKLKRYSAIEHKRVNLFQTQKTRNYLTRSLSKLHAIYNVFTFEHEKMGKDMRMVILTDYIRKELLDTENNKLPEITKIGVVPIFEKIRRNYKHPISMVVLTGSVIIIPKKLVHELDSIQSNLSFTPLIYDSDYFIIKSKNHGTIIQAITHLFESDKIELIIGTKSLLGEGWDAPSINTLLLASAVGSFVTSNQMRGRAIRYNMLKPDKISNIWHFVCIDQTQQNNGNDFEMLKRRFKSFVGPSYHKPLTIQNGVERLNLKSDLFLLENIQQQNQITFKVAEDRAKIKSAWDNALEKGNSLIEEIKVPFIRNENYHGKLTLYWNRTLRNFTGFIFSGILALLTDNILNIIWRFWSFKSFKEISYAIIFALVMTFIYFLIDLTKSVKLYLKYRDITKDIHGICSALLKSLIETGFINTKKEELSLKTYVNHHGEIFCSLDGGSKYEKSLFIQCLEDILSPIHNPRYILIRKSKIFAFKKQEDYHNVPEVLASNKKYAEIFGNYWLNEVGDCELIYTRNPIGRKIFVKAKWASLSFQLNPNYEPLNVWK